MSIPINIDELLQMAPDSPAGQGQVMIIDDDVAVCDMVKKMLTPIGFTVLTETNPRRALERIKAIPNRIDVVLIDLKMPEMSGIDVIKSVKSMASDIVCIVLTGLASADNTIASLRVGAHDFMQKPFNFDDLTISLKRGVEYRRLYRKAETYRQQLGKTLEDRATLNEKESALESAHMVTMEALVAALTECEANAVEHNRRVEAYAVFLARRMNVKEDQIVKIKRGARLHDIGKKVIPDAILQKAGPLTDAEKDIMRQHSTISYRILKNIPFLQEEAEMVYQHHENYNGSGYPCGLAGNDIVFGARLLAVVDAFDALRSDRVYRKAVSLDATLAEICRCSGTQFDPAIVDAFLACCHEMDCLRDRL